MKAVVYLVSEPLVVEPLLAAVARPDAGAAAVFLGTVRNGPEERRHGGVTAIEYTAYAMMAEAECDRIVADARARWPGVGVVLRHRLGTIAVGEASVAVVVAAPHRTEAFTVCRHVIDEVKRRVPIWKREHHADGTATWVDPSGRVTATAPP